MIVYLSMLLCISKSRLLPFINRVAIERGVAAPLEQTQPAVELSRDRGIIRVDPQALYSNVLCNK